MAEPGAKTFLVQQQEVSVAVLNEPIANTETEPTLAQIKSTLNEMTRQFIASRDWLWSRRTDTSLSLVTDQTDYAMIDNLREIIRIRNQTLETKIFFQRRGRFEDQHKGAPSTFSEGIPTIWTYIDPDSDNSVKIRFNTKPQSENNGDVLNITHYLRHVDMVADGSFSILPVEFQDIPIYRTIAKHFKILDDHTNAAIWNNDAQLLENEAWKQHMNQPDHTDTPTDAFQNGPFNQWPFNSDFH